MDATKARADKSSQCQEEDSGGFRFSRKRNRQLRELSPDSKRRRSGHFFVRQSIGSKDLQPIGYSDGRTKISEEHKETIDSSTTVSMGQATEPCKTQVAESGSSSESSDSQQKALLRQLDECGPILDRETEKLVEEKQQWDQLVETYTNRTTEVCRYADAEQSVKLGLDGLPLFLTDKEKDFILAQPNLQEIVSKVEASFQEVEATTLQWLHVTDTIEQWERCVEVHLNDEKKKIAAMTAVPVSPKTAIRGILNSKLSDCK